MVTLLVMQALDNAIAFRPRRRWLAGGWRVVTEQDGDRPNPMYIEVAKQAAQWLARHAGGIAQSNARGVIDQRLQVFGYRNLLVCDGTAMPANPGVNPALTITALAEYAMSRFPSCAGVAGDRTAQAGQACR